MPVKFDASDRAGRMHMGGHVYAITQLAISLVWGEHKASCFGSACHDSFSCNRSTAGAGLARGLRRASPACRAAANSAAY